MALLPYALIILVVLAGAASLGRPIPKAVAAVIVILPLVLIWPAPFAGTSLLPLDHVRNIRPWAGRVAAPAPHNPYLNDIATQVTPWAKAVRVAYKERELPLRNRWNGAGMPLAANSQSAPFSPFTWLTFLVPLAHAFTFLAAARILLALSGMWLWLRELGVSRPSALLAGVAFGLSFSITPLLLFPHAAALCLWPWMLFLIELRQTEPRRLRPTIGLAVVFVCLGLAGHPENAALGAVFAALWILGRRLIGSLRETLVMRAVVLVGVVAFGLVAFQIVPSVLAIAASNRLSLATRPFWEARLSMMPHGPIWPGFITAVFPYALGNGVESPVLPHAIAAVPELSLSYFGATAWAIALLVLRPGGSRPRFEWVLWSLLILGLGIAIGQWPVAELAGRLPGLSLVFPLRFATWVPLAGAAIAAVELDRLRTDLTARRGSWIGAVALPVCLAGLAVLSYLHFREPHAAAGGTVFQARELRLALVLLALLAFVGVVLRHQPTGYAVALVMLCAAELLYRGRRLYRQYSPAELYPPTPLIRFLNEQPGRFRIAGEGSVLFPHTNTFAGVEDIRTHDPVERRDYVEFLDTTVGYPPGDYFKRLKNLDAPVLDFLNVRYLLAAPAQEPPGDRWRTVYSGADGTVFENHRVLPRAFAPRTVVTVASTAPRLDAARNANAAFGPSFRTISRLQSWGDRAYVLGRRAAELPNGPAEITGYTESVNSASFTIGATAHARTTFVVLSLVQDGGWSAADETGAPVPVFLANGPFLALALEPGGHRVTLRYRPPGWTFGVTVSFLTVLVLGAVAAIRIIRKRRDSAATARTPPENRSAIADREPEDHGS